MAKKVFKLPEKIKELRDSFGINQTDFAEVLGNMHYRSVQEWESGARLPNGGTLKWLKHLMVCSSARAEFIKDAEELGILLRPNKDRPRSQGK